jgi:hypothetical protein
MTSTAVPINPAEWGRGPFAIVATSDVIAFIRNPGTIDEATLRARVNAPDDATVLIHGGERASDAITWTCHVCGRERPDAQISVARTLAAIAQDKFPGQLYYVRYCNDCEACTQVATTVPEWPPPAAGAYCIPTMGLHAAPHQGCAQQ